MPDPLELIHEIRRLSDPAIPQPMGDHHRLAQIHTHARTFIALAEAQEMPESPATIEEATDGSDTPTAAEPNC